jgi:hypothetical protein
MFPKLIAPVHAAPQWWKSVKTSASNSTSCPCWAHVRRRFVDAVRVQPKGKRGKADEAVTLIGRLYRIEREHKDALPDDHHSARGLYSVPVLAELRAWMLKTLAACRTWEFKKLTNFEFA